MRNLSKIQRMIKIENKSCKITIQKKYETRTYTKYTTMYNSRGVENPYKRNHLLSFNNLIS